MGNKEMENVNGQVEQMQLEDANAGPKGSDKVPYPKGVFFIMATELSERFSYYGMRAVLTIYMRNVLNFSENVSTSYYHVFLMICYGLPIFWGVVSDSWLGKFRTIVFVSILFFVGNITLALSSIPPLNLPTTGFFFAGLILMAVGTAGMKPCVAPLGGEQFILPQQTSQLQYFFSIFFFVVTIGNMISTIITPIFRRDVSCFDMDNCYPLAFGVPAAIMLFAVIVFACGRPLYKVHTPSGNVLMKVSKCVAHALNNRKRSRKDDDKKSKHWLDAASDSFDESVIADTKGLFRILPYFLPVPMFFALYEQLGSRWTLQATRMNGRIGSFSIKPDQMQVSNAILMFFSLPFFNWVVYPLLGKCGIKLRTLQRMVIGGILAAMSFAVAGFVSMKIAPTINSSPSEGHSIVTFSNNLPCPVTVAIAPSANATKNYILNSEDFLTLPQLTYLEKTSLVVKTAFDNCSISNVPFQEEWVGEVGIISRAYQTIVFGLTQNSSLTVRALPFKDDFSKSKDGNARMRFVLMKDPSITRFQFREEDSHLGKIVVRATNGNKKLDKSFSLQSSENILYSETEEIDESTFDIFYETPNATTSLIKENVKLENGGSYNLITLMEPTWATSSISQLVIITPSNSIHILWLIPQYVLMAWGEILYIVSGMEFAYTEAPLSMKSVVQAVWHLMNAFGNIIVIASAQAPGHSSQTLEFFVFAGLMLVDAIIQYIMSRRYKYVQVDGQAVVMH